MRKMLIAVATAGVVASGIAAADNTTIQMRAHDIRSANIVPVQYYRGDEGPASINDREARINARIQRGLEDGRITNNEARWLYRELRDVEAKERAFASDGRLSYRERAELNADLDRLSAHVRQQMRDEDRRY